MSVTLFITLLTIFSTITSLCTETVKKLLNDTNFNYSSNVLVFIIACIVGAGGTCIYYILNSFEFNSVNIVCMLLMGLATSLSSMVGYDKVIQTIKQIKG